VRLGAAPERIIVGNPAVAGVALKDGDTLLITGKKFGDTAIVVLDGSGRTILSNQIAVRAPRKAKLYPAAAR
jgi:Flp pilus assembly secretin CpaC